MKKTKVYIDIFYYKTALSGIKTYIEQLVQGINKYGRKDVEYIFSHDIEKLKNFYNFETSFKVTMLKHNLPLQQTQYEATEYWLES